MMLAKPGWNLFTKQHYEGSGAFKPGTCGGPTYTGTSVLTESGNFIRNRLRAGANVKLRLDVGIEHRGVVRWANGERAGVRLLDPFVPAQLASARRVA